MFRSGWILCYDDLKDVILCTVTEHLIVLRAMVNECIDDELRICY
jgi:hypothetical protein